jgi:hypothetical protein
MKKLSILFFVLLCSLCAETSFPVFLSSSREKIVFPQKPDHFTKKLSPEIECSIYCTNLNNMTFLTIVIPLEQQLTVEQATLALEGFMSGILHNDNNELKSADMITVNQMPALDFNIISQNIHFRGRTIMCSNHMVLIAVEFSGELTKMIQDFIESYSLEK